ncbi:MAG: SMI1/KNR4 family protein, partial [Candidatus Dormibacteraeota bacterium]|nr:SMI1/KNR4 family protein [Candidatus Dormibacteraeota bacterium]
MISERLVEVSRELVRLGRKTTIALLRPGIPTRASEAMLRQHGLQVPFGLPELYAWHDGTDATTGVPLDDLHLFPGYYFLSLEDATRNYAAFRDDPRWNPAWLPIFANGGGDFFA